MKKTKKIYKINKNNKSNCVLRTTADPRIFGKYVWGTLHIFAQHYPLFPTKKIQLNAINFIKSIPYMLPCPHCGCDLEKYYKTFFSIYPITEVVKSRKKMIELFVGAHNNVSKHTKNQRSNWTIKEASKKWRKNYACLENKKLWMGCRLTRSKKDKIV